MSSQAVVKEQSRGVVVKGVSFVLILIPANLYRLAHTIKGKINRITLMIQVAGILHVPLIDAGFLCEILLHTVDGANNFQAARRTIRQMALALVEPDIEVAFAGKTASLYCNVVNGGRGNILPTLQNNHLVVLMEKAVYPLGRHSAA